ncbi:MAG: cobalt transport protein [Firmicutes bacterium]|nr:cobalt transport protein [Bacillota bacterium]
MLNMNKINPTAKLISNFIVLIVSVMVFDPKTMVMIFVINVFFGVITKSFNKKNLKALIPLAFFALGMLWMNAAWAKVDNPNIIGCLGPINFTDKGLIVGLSLCFRVLTIGISSIIFTANTEPNDLILSLIKQCHLSPGIAYGILTAFRFLPSMEADLALINAAHRIRNAKKKQWYLKKNRWYRNAIPLLATNIRKAERVALAMEARGFENNMQRTYYKTVYWKKTDTIFVLLTVAIVMLILSFSAYRGWLISFQRWQGF